MKCIEFCTESVNHIAWICFCVILKLKSAMSEQSKPGSLCSWLIQCVAFNSSMEEFQCTCFNICK